MAIQYAPKDGTILICNFDGVLPEMVKRRPVVMVSSVSSGLAIVVPLSTTAPLKIKAWHFFLHLSEPLPKPYNCLDCWAKGDMVSVVAFGRLNFPFSGKDKNGKRIYQTNQISNEDLASIRSATSLAIWGSS